MVQALVPTRGWSVRESCCSSSSTTHCVLQCCSSTYTSDDAWSILAPKEKPNSIRDCFSNWNIARKKVKNFDATKLAEYLACSTQKQEGTGSSWSRGTKMQTILHAQHEFESTCTICWDQNFPIYVCDFAFLAIESNSKQNTKKTHCSWHLDQTLVQALGALGFLWIAYQLILWKRKIVHNFQQSHVKNAPAATRILKKKLVDRQDKIILFLLIYK